MKFHDLTHYDSSLIVYHLFIASVINQLDQYHDLWAESFYRSEIIKCVPQPYSLRYPTGLHVKDHRESPNHYPLLTYINLGYIVKLMSNEIVTYEAEVPQIDESKLPTYLDENGKEKRLVNAKQAQIVELVSVQGRTQAEAAQILQCDPGTIAYHLRKKAVKEYQARLVQDKLSSIAVSATSKLGDLLQHKSGYINIEAIKLIFNASGITNDNKNLQVNTSGQTVVNIDLGG